MPTLGNIGLHCRLSARSLTDSRQDFPFLVHMLHTAGATVILLFFTLFLLHAQLIVECLEQKESYVIKARMSDLASITPLEIKDQSIKPSTFFAFIILVILCNKRLFQHGIIRDTSGSTKIYERYKCLKPYRRSHINKYK